MANEVVAAESAEKVELPKGIEADLKAEELATRIKLQRETALDVGKDPEKKDEEFISLPEVIEGHSRYLGLSLEEFGEAAKAQELDIEWIVDEVGRKGRDVEEVMSELATKPYQQAPELRKAKARGKEIKITGLKRIRAGEKKLDPDTKAETVKRLIGSLDPKDAKPYIFTGDADTGEAEDMVVRPGQVGYDRLMAISNSKIDPKIAADAERAKMISDLLRRSGPQGTGALIRDSIAESGFQEIVNSIAVYDLNKEAGKAGVSRGTAEYEELKEHALKNALYEATLFRATNKHFLPGFISYDMIDPRGKLTGLGGDEDDTWVEKAWKNASNVRVEVIGLDSKGVPVYRLTHPTWHIFEMLDAVQSGVVGAGERVLGGPEDEGVLTAIYEGSLEGIKNRRDFLKAALSTEAADSSTLAAFAMGTAGLAAAILFPDLLIGAAGVARTTKKIATAAADAARFRKLAPGLNKSLGSGAESLAKSEEIMGDGLEDALRSGDYDEALRILDEAKEFASKSDDAIIETRKLDQGIATVVDEVDADIGRRLEKVVPESGGVEGRRLSASVPGAFGATQQNLHPSTRRVILRGDAPDQVVPFYELLGSRQTIESLQDTIRLLKSGEISEQFLTHLRMESNGFLTSIRGLMNDAKVGLSTPNLDSAQRQSVLNLVDYLIGFESTRLLRDDPSKWSRKVTSLAQKLPFDPDNIDAQTDFLKALSKLSGETISSAKKVEKTLKRTITVAEAAEATAKAVKAVRANFEARAASMAFVRERVAKQAGIKAEPLLVELTEKHKAIGRERLSPEALDFMEQIEAAVPAMRGDPALKIAKWLDQRARKWANKNERAIREYYEARFKGVIRQAADEVPPTAVTPPPAGVPPRGPVASAPKKKPLPKLKSTPSEGLNFGRQAKIDGEPAGLAAEVLYDHIHTMESGLEVAEFLLKHAELDSTRALIRRILPILKKDPPAFSIEVGGDISTSATNLGVYRRATNEVGVSGPGFVRTGLTEEIITHELIHAATARFIALNPNHKSVKALDALNTDVVDIIRRQLAEGGHSAEGVKIRERFAAYLDDPGEFITLALTNPDFQRLLRTIEIEPKKTAWNKFTRLLANLFGVTAEDETNALARALVVSESVIRGAAKETTPVRVTTDLDVVVRRADDTDVIELTSPFLEQAGQGGDMVLRKADAFDSAVLQVDSVEIPETLRGQGLGVDLYLRALAHAKNQGVGFLSDMDPSFDALHVYKALDELGVKFTRKPMQVDQGEIANVYFIDARDLKKVDLEGAMLKHSKEPLQQPLFARLGDDFASDPVVVEFLEDGRAVIKAMSESATVEDFVRALGKVTRRDLDPTDMKALVTWLGSKGIKVGHDGAVFTADDAAVIQQAEDEFARAFQTYLASGRADQPEIEGAIRKTIASVKDMYASFKGAEVAGASLDMDDGLRRTLDKLLREPSERTGMPNILSITKDALFTPKLGGTEVDVMDQIVRETHRLGYPISRSELKRQWKLALKADPTGKSEEAVIQLPGPISFGGQYGPGRGRYTLSDLNKIQFDLEQARLLELDEATKLPIGGAHMGIGERTPSELVDQHVSQSHIGHVFRGMFLGGDAYGDMRNLPPSIRNAIMAGARRVQQAVGDSVTLVAEGNLDNLMRYLTGKPTVQFAKGGRSAMSAGHDSVATVMNSLTTYFNHPLRKEKMEDLTVFMDLLRVHKTTAAVMKELPNHNIKAETIAEIFNDLVNQPTSSRFLRDAFEAAGFKGTKIDPKFLARATEGQDPGGLLEVFLYYSDIILRKSDPSDTEGKLFSTLTAGMSADDRSTSTFIRMYEEIGTLFPADKNVANRISILMAGHGMAYAAKMDWVKMGLAADEGLASAVKMYLIGERIPDEMIVRVKNFVETLGYNPRIVDGFDLRGTKMYLPKAARERLAMALSQAQDPAVAKLTKGDVFSVMAAGEDIATRGTNSTTKYSAALMYRYIKTRMVRGHFVLKSRYFWMNTFDHFNQTAQRVGYRTAFISTTRMFTQNVLSNPIGQAAVFAARRAGKGESVEEFRRVLQAGGDKGAEWAGKLTRGSKWHISVNDVLKGGDEIIMLGGKPYTHTQLRQVFLEAGIFASFDTSQLGTRIQNVGNLFLEEQKKRGRLTQMGKDILGDMKGASEDIAEAWAERERVGLAITLMEGGLDPRTAAKITIDALYDYAGSMSKADRNFLVNIFFPFWAFQKNANRQYFDALFSPEGAYRLGVMRRAYDKGSDTLSELVYAATVDENGVDVSALPDELRQSYFALKKDVYERYAVEDRVPAIVREELRMFIQGSVIGYKDGHLLQTGILQEEIEEISRRLQDEEGKPLVIDRRALSSFYVPRTDRSSMPSYFRDRLSVRFPYSSQDAIDTFMDPDIPSEFKDTMKTWIDLYRERRPDAPYMSLFLPEPTFTAAYNHFSYLMSAMVLTLGEIENKGDKWFTDEDDGSDAISPVTPLNALLNTPRTPVVSDVMASLDVGGAQYPKRVSVSLVNFFERLGLDVLELDERDDPFSLVVEQKEAEAEGREAPELPVKERGAETRRDRVYYLMPGVGQLAWNNSPIGEMNDFLLRIEKTSPERAAGLRGEIQRQFRVWSGLDMKDVSRTRTAAAEKWRAEKESKVTGKKVMKPAKLK
jgi:hypothetical protein